MTKEEFVIRNILGPSHSNTLAFSIAVRNTAHMLFVEKIPQDEIQVINDIYAQVGAELKKNHKSVARQIERIENLCWNAMDKKQKMKYIGRNLRDIQSPRDMLFYLAYYCYYQIPYYELMDAKLRQPSSKEEIGADLTK